MTRRILNRPPTQTIQYNDHFKNKNKTHTSASSEPKLVTQLATHKISHSSIIIKPFNHVSSYRWPSFVVRDTGRGLSRWLLLHFGAVAQTHQRRCHGSVRARVLEVFESSSPDTQVRHLRSRRLCSSRLCSCVQLLSPDLGHGRRK